LLGLQACGNAEQNRFPRLPEPPELVGAYKQGDAGNCTTIGFIKATQNAFNGDGLKVFAEFVETGACTPKTITDPCDDTWIQKPKMNSFRAKTRDGHELSVSCNDLDQATESSKLCQTQRDARGDALLDSARHLYAAVASSCARSCKEDGYECPYVFMKETHREECAADPARASCSTSDKTAVCTVANALKYLDAGLKYSIPPNLLGLNEGEDFKLVKGNKVGRWLRTPRFVSSHRSCVVAKRKHTFFVSQGWADLYGTARTYGSRFGSWLVFSSATAYCLLFDTQNEPEMEASGDLPGPPADAVNDVEIKELEQLETN
jgi:hypothetical protein